MQTYLAILRGINVGGHHLIAMKELKALFEDLRFQGVRTYIQSGNVVFQAPDADPQTLAARIEARILEQYQFPVPVLIRTAAELKAALDRNPFLQPGGPDPDKLHVTFLADHPDPARLAQVDAYNGPDACSISEREVFLYCPQGYGNTKLNNSFFEKKLGVRATTRNLKTVRHLVGMAEAAG
jgi:uncharacterized protein (DUF1697 family)